MRAEVIQPLLLVPLSFLLALVLSVMIPPASWVDALPALDSVGRPEWSLLFLIYWTVRFPDRIGVVAGWTLGLMEDFLQGATLGEHALAFMLTSWFTVSFHKALDSMSVWQQCLLVFLLVGFSQLCQLLIGGMFFGNLWFSMLFVAVITAMLWPSTFLCMQRLTGRSAV